MKKHENNLKLDAWDFVPGKNPVGEMAIVHIPMDKISWFAHSADKRLDIGINENVLHLLQRDSGKNEATNEEIARSVFNKVGCAYWIEENLDDLYEQLEAILEDRLLDELIKEKVHDPKDWETAKALLSVKLPKQAEDELLKTAETKGIDIKKLKKAAKRFLDWQK